MRIAVTYDNGQIFQHFGHTAQFKIYDVEAGVITNSMVIGTDGQGHSALVGFLSAAKVDVLICGGIGGGAQAALAQAGIKLYGGAAGAADDAANAFAAGTLNYCANVRCAHHEEGRGEHSCGEHSCSAYGCGRDCH